MHSPAESRGVIKLLVPLSLGLLCLALLGAAFGARASTDMWVQQNVVAAAPGSTGSPAATSVSFFGAAVAVVGNTAVIGAPSSATAGNLQQGAVYLFTKSADRVWQQSGLLLADDGAAYDQFGAALAVSGHYLIIGAPGVTVNGNASQGAVYVFSDSSGSWVQLQKLVASDGAAGDEFGEAVALDGNHLLIAARYAKVGGNALQGAVYDFDLSGGSWSQTQKLVASDGVADTQFGSSLAVDGTMALVGATGANVGGEALRGAVYVFNYASGAWGQTQKIVASNGVAGDLFGTAVALGSGQAMVGAPNAGTATNSVNQGRVYAYERSGTVLTRIGELVADNGASGDQFGSVIAMQGGRALIGTRSNTGEFYLFSLADGQWTQSMMFAGGNNGGSSLALRGRLLLAGVPARGAGSVFFYLPVNLALAISAPADVMPEDELAVDITVTNNAATLTPPVTALTFPPDASTHASAVPTQGECTKAVAYVCNLDNLAGNGGTAKISMKYEVTKAAAATTLTNSVSTVNVLPLIKASTDTSVGKKNSGGGGGAFTLGLLGLLGLCFTLWAVRRKRG